MGTTFSYLSNSNLASTIMQNFNICDCCLKKSLSESSFYEDEDTWTTNPPAKTVSWNALVWVKMVQTARSKSMEDLCEPVVPANIDSSLNLLLDKSTSMDDLFLYDKKNN